MTEPARLSGKDLGTEEKTVQRDRLRLAQEAIYDFFLTLVQAQPADKVVAEFNRLFIHHTNTLHSSTLSYLDDILIRNQEQEFRFTLKRSCYTLINNWVIVGDWISIQCLIYLFDHPVIYQSTLLPLLKRLREWLQSFILSQDFQELQIYAARGDASKIQHWSQRYTSYLLVAQSFDAENSVEQQQAARQLATQLQERFKFDLAMYTTLAQSKHAKERPLKNPTGLGDRVLRLMTTLVAKRGFFSYANLAHIFLRQVQSSSYEEFKRSLQLYLMFSVRTSAVVHGVERQLAEKLNGLYVEHHADLMGHALLLRTVNRVVGCLTTEDHKTPSSLFIKLAANHPLTLSVLLLKLMFICPHSRAHLEVCIGTLVQYYANCPETDCQSIVYFLRFLTSRWRPARATLSIT